MFSLKGVADPSCVPNHTKIRVELHLPDPLLPAFVCFRTSGEDYAACGISALSLLVGTKWGLSQLLLSYPYALAKARGIISRLQKTPFMDA